MTEWHEWRRHGIGGSDIPALMGWAGKYGSPVSVWADKVGLLPPSDTSERQQIGKDFEAPLAASFNRATGLYIGGEQMWCIDQNASHRRCTLDGLVFESPTSEDATAAVGAWECKTDAGWQVWEHADNVPQRIKAQSVWNAGVTNMPGTWLTVMHGSFRIEHIWIPFDPILWEQMAREADRFWTTYVVTGDMPPADDSDATKDALDAIWPDHIPGQTADIDPELIDRWQTAAAIRRGAEKAEKALKNMIAMALGAAEIGQAHDLPLVTYRTQAGRKRTCPECGHTQQGDPFRVLRPTKHTNQEKNAA